jgi:hypothetical protein
MGAVRIKGPTTPSVASAFKHSLSSVTNLKKDKSTNPCLPHQHISLFSGLHIQDKRGSHG